MEKILARRFVNKGEIFEQSLKNHLLWVARLAGNIGEKVDLEYTSIVLGLIHDCGKATDIWQEYLLSNGKKDMVTHSDVSAMYLHNKLLGKYKHEASSVILYVVTAHHGLYDNIEENEADFFDAAPLCKKVVKDKNLINEIDKFFTCIEKDINEVFGFNIDELLDKSLEEMKTLFSKLKNISYGSEGINIVEYNYYIHLSTRLLLSILKEADIFDSSNAFRRDKYELTSEIEKEELWRYSSEKIELLYKKFSKSKSISELNLVRTRLSEEAREKAESVSEGILKAELPTGSGKTLLTMRYALSASNVFNKDRIFYIAPFLSILDQNAREIRNLVSNENLLIEHHSNIISESDYTENTSNKNYDIEQYLIDSWESPLVMTTMVQFTNTLFKGRASNIRRFCKLINSTIIIDEVQSLPLKALYNFSLVNNFISKIMNTMIIHCTATQPDLDSKYLKHRVQYGVDGNSEHLSRVLSSEKHVFERVKVINLNYKRTQSYSTDEISSQILKKYYESGNTLVICNTKSAVKKIYNKLGESIDSLELYYLTTNMCASHRIDTINKIKEKIEAGERVICISTSLVEAGVDIDFKVVFKSMSSISSLIQAAGRCNREGKLKEGYLYIFKYFEEKLASLKEIKVGADITEEILLEIDSEQINLDDIKNRYYSKLYANSDKKELSYRTRDECTTILDMLSTNRDIIKTSEAKIARDLNKLILRQSFKKASMEFNLIEDTGKTVIVYYESDNFSNEELIEELKESEYDYEKYKYLIKRLQPYTISVRNIKDITVYLDSVLAGDIYVLNKSYYDSKVGLNTGNLETLIL